MSAYQNVRSAILRAADWIGGHPNDFDFMEVMVPKENKCGTPGCAIGWVNHFAGNRIGSTIGYAEDINAVLGITITAFYERMDDIATGQEWRYSPKSCAVNLRAYADKYFPAELPQEIIRKSGSEVAREIMSRKFDEKELANV